MNVVLVDVDIVEVDAVTDTVLDVTVVVVRAVITETIVVVVVAVSNSVLRYVEVTVRVTPEVNRRVDVRVGASSDRHLHALPNVFSNAFRHVGRRIADLLLGTDRFSLARGGL